MGYPIRKVYEGVCRMLLEDNGLELVYSPESFLQDLTVSLRTFLQESGLVKDVSEIQGFANVSKYTIDDEHMAVLAAFWNDNHIDQNSGFFQDESDPYWESQPGMPEQFREDKLDKNTIQIAPIPTANGTLKVICTEQSPADTLTMEQDVPLLPPSFCSYLKFFVLERIWKGDGEARDLERAKYAQARYTEALNIARAISKEDLLSE